MTTFIDVGADNVLGLRINGKISEKEFDTITALLEEKMQKHPKVRIYAEIESFGGSTLETFFKDLKFGIDNWDRFEREAVVTQKRWMQKVVDISDQVFPGIEVQAFGFTEKEKAKYWIQN